MRPLPRVGDLLWCKFPERPRDLPGPKLRPVLVLAVSSKTSVIKCAYGTSQHLDHLHRGEFAIRKNILDMRAFLQSGLNFDTKFNLGHTHDLPWSDEYFIAPGNTSSILIGTLHDSLIPSIRAAYAAIQP